MKLSLPKILSWWVGNVGWNWRILYRDAREQIPVDFTHSLRA